MAIVSRNAEKGDKRILNKRQAQQAKLNFLQWGVIADVVYGQKAVANLKKFGESSKETGQ